MMQEILQVFANRTLGTAILSWIVAQSIKVLLVLMTTRKLDFTRLIGAGGMPSAHSAFVTSLAFAVGFRVGFDSAVFALAVAFALVVMYDAAGVRRAAGKQAERLNHIMNELLEQGRFPPFEELKELLGHTPVEVLAGAALGIFISILRR